MLQSQPSPMVVIRNQLLAFMVLNLLGSCVPGNHVQPDAATSANCCSQQPPAAKVLPTQLKLLTTQPQSR